MTHRDDPVVKYSVPPIISGVLSFLYSGGALKLSDFQRQATARLVTFAGVMASSGEYRVPARSRW